MSTEHPFAQYIRILGKGKRGSRSLTQQEALESMRMILNHSVEDCQLGAFLMLLRVKEETPEEVAGFVQAVRETFVIPENSPAVELDWSSYAGKRRHLPWYLLTALLLADSGIKVFMHGAEGHTAGRIYTRDVMQALQLPVAMSLEDATTHLSLANFAYLPLQHLSSRMHDIIEMRPLLGLRSPVHTIARMLNPFKAKYEIQGVFHPTYRDTHQQAAALLGQPHLAVLKGEGGEIERNPDQICLVKQVDNGRISEEEWPALFNGPRHLKDETMDIQRMISIWDGSDSDEYPIASITGTAAVALKLMGKANTIPAAEEQARQLWKNRNSDRFGHVAL